MVFLFDDAWYVMLSKLLIVFLAMALMSKIIHQSKNNCVERIFSLIKGFEEKGYNWSVVSSFVIVLVNVFFIWLMAQGLVLLLFGFLGNSPKELLLYGFQSKVLVVVSLLIAINIFMKWPVRNRKEL